jgi:hypothetical protein
MLFKIAKTLLMLSIISIVVFTIIYRYLDDISWIDSLYTSSMIQTLVGVQKHPSKDITKIGMTFQSIISYFISAHIIILSVRYIKC